MFIVYLYVCLIWSQLTTIEISSVDDTSVSPTATTHLDLPSLYYEYRVVGVVVHSGMLTSLFWILLYFYIVVFHIHFDSCV